MRMSTALVILALTVLHGACDSVRAELCPQYVVQSGDTPESIAAAAALDLAALVAAIQACGGAVDALTPGAAICLPGGGQPGCVHVRPIGAAAAAGCKVYVTQAGDTLSSVAASLALFEPDLAGANPASAAASLREGDLLKLPGWDDAVCGAAPATLAELDAAPPPATTLEVPIQSPPAAPEPQEAAVARAPSAAPEVAPSAACRAFRAREQDDLYAIAALFAVNAVEIIAANPAIAAGVPLAGAILRIPPYAPSCPYPLLVSAEEAAAAAAAPAPAPVPLPAAGPAAAPAVRVADAVARSAEDKSPPVEFAAVSADLGGREDTVADQEPQISNIVKDGGNSNAPPAPPPAGSDDTGAIIMGACVGAVVLAVLVMLAWAVANSKARMSSKGPGSGADSDAASSVTASSRTGSETNV